MLQLVPEVIETVVEKRIKQAELYARFVHAFRVVAKNGDVFFDRAGYLQDRVKIKPKPLISQHLFENMGKLLLP